LFTCSAVLLPAAGTSSGSILTSGNTGNLWIIQAAGDTEPSFAVYARKVGSNNWINVSRITGTPIAARTMNEDLFVMVKGGHCMIISDKGEVLPVDTLAVDDADSVGLCEMRMEKLRENTVAAAVARTGDTARDPLQIYRLFGSEWKLAATDKNRPWIPPLVSHAGGNIFVLDSNKYLRKISPDGTKSTAIRLVEGKPFAMFEFNGRLLVARSEGDSSCLVRISWYDTEKDCPEIGTSVISSDGSPVNWKPDNIPAVTPAGEKIFLFWKENGTLISASCNLSGKITKKPLTDTLSRASSGQIENYSIINYFFLGLTMFVVILVFVVRPKTRPKPFHLPPPVRPGNLGLRFLAVVVDFILVEIATSPILLLVIGAEKLGELTSRYQKLFKESFLGSEQTSMPAGFTEETMLILIIIYLAISTVFIVYGIIGEYRYGTTIGKKLFKLRVTGDEDTRPGLREIMIRNVMKLLELNAFSTWWFVPILLLFPLLSRAKQRLGDQLARTAVVRDIKQPEI